MGKSSIELTCQYIHSETLWGINQKNHAWSPEIWEGTRFAVTEAVK